MSELRLTYCGNVHPAGDLDEWLAVTRQNAVPVARHMRAAGRPFGLGAWWPAPVAERLATDAAARERVARDLELLGLPLWTLNVFPYEGFHDAVVKTAVYRPDWATEERLLYTRHCAEAVAALCPAGSEVAMSTLPLGFSADGDRPADLRLMARNLARAASHLRELHDRTGVRCVLALEPEPLCLLERADATAAFLEQWLFEEGAWPTVPVAALRAHLGVCVDLCHLAVVGEDPVTALRDLHARGIAVPKIQVSSCLEVRDAAGLEQLWAFDEPRYLHQTVGAAAAAPPPRALDLAAARARRDEFAARLPVRTHFHMPLWWDREGAFGSTRREVERTLAALQRGEAGDGPLPLLEVETYTWPVLDAAANDADMTGGELHQRLARELDFAAKSFAP